MPEEQKTISLKLTQDEAAILRETLIPIAEEGMKIRVALQNGEVAMKVIDGIEKTTKKE